LKTFSLSSKTEKHEDLDLGQGGLDPADPFDPAHAGESDVEKHHIGTLARDEGLDRIFATLVLMDALHVLLAIEDAGHGTTQGFIVFHHPDSRRGLVGCLLALPFLAHSVILALV
jgi:hypothetical protein